MRREVNTRPVRNDNIASNRSPATLDARLRSRNRWKRGIQANGAKQNPIRNKMRKKNKIVNLKSITLTPKFNKTFLR